ncbi:MAG TPA: methylated-DNA--[protein]-cysteine S-methyltransferase [Sphingobacteriaceae bacterium]
MFTSTLGTPLGQLIIRGNEEAVFYIGYGGDADQQPNAITDQAKKELEEYFSGKRLDFTFPVAQPGTTFQHTVWKELTKIEAGKPVSYTALSKRMNNPLAIRAIASANGKNNLMIVVPCHRVIGASGDLVGYAGGLWRKKWLLEHEANMTGSGQASLF